MYVCMDGWMDGWKDGLINGWMDVHICMHGCMVACVHVYMLIIDPGLSPTHLAPCVFRCLVMS